MPRSEVGSSGRADMPPPTPRLGYRGRRSAAWWRRNPIFADAGLAKGWSRVAAAATAARLFLIDRLVKATGSLAR
jgi:hypothetical protein